MQVFEQNIGPRCYYLFTLDNFCQNYFVVENHQQIDKSYINLLLDTLPMSIFQENVYQLFTDYLFYPSGHVMFCRRKFLDMTSFNV